MPEGVPRGFFHEYPPRGLTGFESRLLDAGITCIYPGVAGVGDAHVGELFAGGAADGAFLGCAGIEVYDAGVFFVAGGAAAAADAEFAEVAFFVGAAVEAEAAGAGFAVGAVGVGFAAADAGAAFAV